MMIQPSIYWQGVTKNEDIENAGKQKRVLESLSPSSIYIYIYIYMIFGIITGV
jgi:hypothetical protein